MVSDLLTGFVQGDLVRCLDLNVLMQRQLCHRNACDPDRLSDGSLLPGLSTGSMSICCSRFYHRRLDGVPPEGLATKTDRAESSARKRIAQVRARALRIATGLLRTQTLELIEQRRRLGDYRPRKPI